MIDGVDFAFVRFQSLNMGSLAWLPDHCHRSCSFELELAYGIGAWVDDRSTVLDAVAEDDVDMLAADVIVHADVDLGRTGVVDVQV